MSGSTGVKVRKAVADGLATHLGGLPEFNGTSSSEREVVVGYAFDFATNAAEQVFTGRSRATTDPAAILRSGRNHRDEEGEFDLTIRVVFVGAESAYDSDARAFAIGAEVEEWIADRKSGSGLNITGLTELSVRGWESDYGGVDGGAASLLTYRVRWRARLT